MEVLVQVLYFAAACAVLIFASGLAIKTMTRIARFLKVSEYLVSFVVLAVATSIPELFVGINSSRAGTGAISLGNIVGANLINVTLIIGIAALISGRMVVKSKKDVHKDSMVMLIIMLLPALLYVLGDGLSRLDGGILLATGIGYYWFAIRNHQHPPEERKDEVSRNEAFLNALGFGVALGLLFISSEHAVKAAKNIAVILNTPELIIGIIVVSIGTTLPELTVAVRSALMHHSDIAIGDGIGTIISNSTLIIGAAALVAPMHTDTDIYLASTFFMAVAAFVFIKFLSTKDAIERWEGAVLIALYVAFILFQLKREGFF
jgi:cation:H+ antiporter